MGRTASSYLVFGVDPNRVGFPWSKLSDDDNLDSDEIQEKLGDFGHMIYAYDEGELYIGYLLSHGDWNGSKNIDFKDLNEDKLKEEYSKLLLLQSEETQDILKDHEPQLMMISSYF